MYKKLIIDNNGAPTNEAQRTSLSDTAPSNSSVSYVFDEVNIVGSAQFALKVANTDNAIRTNLTISTLSGDGTGTLQALANTQVSILNAVSNPSYFASTSVATSPLSTSQSTTIQYANSNLFLNMTSIYIYNQGLVVLPASVTVAGGSTVRCQGQLFGMSSMTLVESGSTSFYSACSTSPVFSNNSILLSDLFMGGSSSISLIHDKTVSTFLWLNVSSSLTMQDSSTMYVTGLVQIQTGVLNQSSSTSTITAAGTGFTQSMTNVFCPQNVGQNGDFFKNFIICVNCVHQCNTL